MCSADRGAASCQLHAAKDQVLDALVVRDPGDSCMTIHGTQIPNRPPLTPGVKPVANIALIVIDDIGLDQLVVYDDVNQHSTPYAYPHTPNLSALAASGVRFTQAR